MEPYSEPQTTRSNSSTLRRVLVKHRFKLLVGVAFVLYVRNQNLKKENDTLESQLKETQGHINSALGNIVAVESLFDVGFNPRSRAQYN